MNALKTDIIKRNKRTTTVVDNMKRKKLWYELTGYHSSLGRTLSRKEKYYASNVLYILDWWTLLASCNVIFQLIHACSLFKLFFKPVL